MSIDELIAEQKEETLAIVEALLEDGSDPKAIYAIEHHLVSTDFDDLEKAAVDAVKAGFHVEDEVEELEDEDGTLIYCCDVLAEHELSVERLDKDCDTLIQIAEKHEVTYDGWGTHFIEPELNS